MTGRSASGQGVLHMFRGAGVLMVTLAADVTRQQGSGKKGVSPFLSPECPTCLLSQAAPARAPCPCPCPGPDPWCAAAPPPWLWHRRQQGPSHCAAAHRQTRERSSQGAAHTETGEASAATGLTVASSYSVHTY
jgi:hypothetical protein